MLGSPSKIHHKYDISEDDLDKLRAIAISKGMKVPSYSRYSSQRPSSVGGPHSTPRNDEEEDAERQGSAKTIIPTGETMSIAGEQSSLDKTETTVEKEDRATSDHEDNIHEGTPLEEDSEAGSKSVSEEEKQERQSVKSDSAVLKPNSSQRSVTFLTEDQNA